LRQAFQDLADAKPLREQPANSVHRAVTATIHADLRSRKGAPHRLGLIDMNVAIGLDAVRQTIDLGGETEKVDAEFSQFAGSRKANRLVLTVGKFSVVDIFDTNKYANSPNSDFLSWSTVNAGSFDYAGDAWAYSYGAAAEWYQGNWTLRGGVFDTSQTPAGAFRLLGQTGKIGQMPISPRILASFVGEALSATPDRPERSDASDLSVCSVCPGVANIDRDRS
jgi:hypothetical protein